MEEIDDTNCQDAERRVREHPNGKLILYRSLREDEDYYQGLSSKCHINDRYICSDHPLTKDIFNHVSKGKSHTIFISFSLCAKTVAYWASQTFNKFVKIEVDYDPDSIKIGDSDHIPEILPLCDTTMRQFSKSDLSKGNYKMVKNFYNASAEVLITKKVPRENIKNIYRVISVDKEIYDLYKDVVRINYGCYSAGQEHINCRFITSCKRCTMNKCNDELKNLKYLFIYETYNKDEMYKNPNTFIRIDASEIQTMFEEYKGDDFKRFFTEEESLVRMSKEELENIDEYDLFPPSLSSSSSSLFDMSSISKELSSSSSSLKNPAQLSRQTPPMLMSFSQTPSMLMSFSHQTPIPRKDISSLKSTPTPIPRKTPKPIPRENFSSLKSSTSPSIKPGATLRPFSYASSSSSPAPKMGATLTKYIK